MFCCLWVSYHSSKRYVVSIEYKICILPTKLHKLVVFHEDWVLLDAEKDVYFNSYVSVHLLHMAFPASLRCMVIVWVAAALGCRWREMNVMFAFTGPKSMLFTKQSMSHLKRMVLNSTINGYWFL
jgi:hypothetical protein